MKEAKNAPVENMTKVMDTLETSIAPKKVIQCNATTIPAIANLKNVCRLILSFIFDILIKANIKNPAISMRNQTNGIALIVMSLPNIAVKPAIKTNKCRCK